jgi:hypothetical protein
MSQEDVEVVRGLWKTYNDRGIDAALDYWAEDCVREDVPDLPTPRLIEARQARGRGSGTSRRLGGTGPGSWRRSSMRAMASSSQ